MNKNQLRSRNNALARENAELQNAVALKRAELKNSMNSLIQSAFGQTNLTTFNEILKNNIYAPLTINWTMLLYMYKTHGIIQTAIDMPVLDALRGSLELHSDQLSPDELKDLEDKIEEDGILQVICDAMIWARLFGGGGIVINTEGDPSKPLADRDLKGRVEFYDANRWELSAPHRVAEEYNFYGQHIHHSRVIQLLGKRAPYIIRWQLNGWGMSEIERMVEDFNAYIKNKNVIYELLNEAKVDVYSLKGYNANLASGPGTEIVRKRVQMANEIKTFQNAILLDKDDSFEQKQITFSGLAEIMKENRIGIASALRIPMTKLFGISAAGLSSGEDDIENYNAMVESEIREPLKRPIRKVLNMVVQNLYGKGFDIGFRYKPLRVMGATEEEAVKASKATRYLSLYDRGLVDSTEVGQIMQKDALIPMEIEAAKGNLDPHPAPNAQMGGDGIDEQIKGKADKRPQGDTDGTGK